MDADFIAQKCMVLAILAASLTAKPGARAGLRIFLRAESRPSLSRSRLRPGHAGRSHPVRAASGATSSARRSATCHSEHTRLHESVVQRSRRLPTCAPAMHCVRFDASHERSGGGRSHRSPSRRPCTFLGFVKLAGTVHLVPQREDRACRWRREMWDRGAALNLYSLRFGNRGGRRSYAPASFGRGVSPGTWSPRGEPGRWVR
jgi:hypothetical protein